jgi:hypothetical protein
MQIITGKWEFATFALLHNIGFNLAKTINSSSDFFPSCGNDQWSKTNKPLHAQGFSKFRILNY